MKKYLFPIMMLTVISVSSCDDNENLDEALFATWQVTKVEGLYYFNNIPTFPVSDNDPDGTIEFNEDGSGFQNYSFQLAGSIYPHVNSFTWTATDSQIIIDLVDEPDMVWSRTTNLTNKQVATYTIVVDANQKWDYTLTLEK